MAIVDASVDQVWRLLSDPANYSLWWDATTDSIAPAGPARSGQVIDAHTRALGREWAVRVEVEGVDEEHRQLQLTTQLPLGMVGVDG